jgi:hypothetical protein
MRKVLLLPVISLFLFTFFLILSNANAGTILQTLNGNSGNINYYENRAYTLGSNFPYTLSMYSISNSSATLLWSNDTQSLGSGGNLAGNKNFDVIVYGLVHRVYFFNGSTGQVFNTFISNSSESYGYPAFPFFINNWNNVVVIEGYSERSPFTKTIWLLDKYGNVLDMKTFYVDGYVWFPSYNSPYADRFTVCFTYGYSGCVSYRVSGNSLDTIFTGISGYYITSLFSDGNYTFIGTASPANLLIFNQTSEVKNISLSGGVYNVKATNSGNYYRIVSTTNEPNYIRVYNYYPSTNTLTEISNMGLAYSSYIAPIYFVTPLTFYVIDGYNHQQYYVGLDGNIRYPAPQGIPSTSLGTQIGMKDFISSSEENQYLLVRDLGYSPPHIYLYAFCNCTAWSSATCFDNVSRTYTRSCEPINCSSQIKYVTDSSCAPAQSCGFCNWNDYSTADASNYITRTMCAIGNVFFCYPIIYLIVIVVVIAFFWIKRHEG